MSRLRADETGALGGLELLPFGFLVFVALTLVVANAWGVLDAKMAAAAAAREATRAFVESDAPAVGTAWDDARRAAAEALTGHGRDVDRMTVTPLVTLELRRCAPVVVEVAYRVPTVSVPWVGGFGAGVLEVRDRHAEVVDPYRDGVPVDPGAGPVCGA